MTALHQSSYDSYGIRSTSQQSETRYFHHLLCAELILEAVSNALGRVLSARVCQGMPGYARVCHGYKKSTNSQKEREKVTDHVTTRKKLTKRQTCTINAHALWN